MTASRAAAASSAPKASLARRWCQVIVVFAGPAKLDLVVRAVDLDVHVHGGRLRERVEQGADGRDRGLVGGEPPVVRRRLKREPAAGAGHRELVARLGPLRPRRRRALAVQQELDLQGPGGRVVAARGVGADRRRRAVLGDGAVRGELRQVRRVLAVGRQEHLEVRGRRGVREPVEVIAGDEHGHQPGRDLRHRDDLGAPQRLAPPRAAPELRLMLEWSREVLSLMPLGPAAQRWPAQRQCRCLVAMDSQPRTPFRGKDAT